MSQQEMDQIFFGFTLVEKSQHIYIPQPCMILSPRRPLGPGPEAVVRRLVVVVRLRVELGGVWPPAARPALPEQEVLPAQGGELAHEGPPGDGGGVASHQHVGRGHGARAHGHGAGGHLRDRAQLGRGQGRKLPEHDTKTLS